MKFPRGYIQVSKNQFAKAFLDQMKKILTIVPKPTSSFNEDEEVVIRLYEEDEKHIYVPRGFFNDYLKKYVSDFDGVKANYSLGGSYHKASSILLRPGQEESIASAFKSLQMNSPSGAIIEAPTGAGKTILLLETSRRLGLKTLVIVPTTVLLDQWIGEIYKFFPNWRVGKLQGDEIDIENKDVVVGMLHSASMKEYPEYVYSQFGTLLIDEVHRCGAFEFSKVLFQFNPRYMVGASGTLFRADRAEKVFLYGIGPVVKAQSDLKVLDPEIYFIDSGVTWNQGAHSTQLDRFKPQFLKTIVANSGRNQIIINQAHQAASHGRQILILSERVGHVEFLSSELKKLGCDAETLVGSTPKAKRVHAQKAQIICATHQLIGTGFNEPRLDTLIMATPCQEVFQAVGRILRTHPNKKKPLVLDLVDYGHLPQILGMSRRKKYRGKNWKILGGEVFQRNDFGLKNN